MTKKWLLTGIIVALAGAAHAEPIRTVLTKENKLPKQFQSEVGVEARYEEFEFRDETAIAPYLRYGLTKRLAAFGTIPYRTIEDDLGNKERGFGDATVGIEFKAYENFFRYPWIMPHAAVTLSNGDKDKGLGTGDTEYMVGVAMGTTVNEEFLFALDVRYNILDDQENIPSLGASIVWELDRQFSLIAEMELARDKERDTHPITFLGGMHYKVNRNWAFGLHGGTTKNSDRELLIQGKISTVF